MLSAARTSQNSSTKTWTLLSLNPLLQYAAALSCKWPALHLAPDPRPKIAPVRAAMTRLLTGPRMLLKGKGPRILAPTRHLLRTMTVMTTRMRMGTGARSAASSSRAKTKGKEA